MSAEEQLHEIIHNVIHFGVEIEDPRTGEETFAYFDDKIYVHNGEFPWFTTVLASPRLAFEELWFFMRGDTDTRLLEEKGVNFWSGNTSKEAQKKAGVGYLNEGELGAAYSQQWRNSGGYDEFRAQDLGISSPRVGHNEGVDQLQELLYGLRNNKYGRRHVVTLWNPVENDFGVITACWHTVQFVVMPDRNGNDLLHVKLMNRSLDSVFGARYAIMQYRMLQMALCRMFGFELGSESCDLTHVHVYKNQVEYAKELLTRDATSHENCSIRIKDDVHLVTMDDLVRMTWDDWEMKYEWNKTPFSTPRPEMVT